jgi:hypothetical protein
MSDSKKLPDGTPIASYDDAVEFLQKRAPLPCPACGTNDWTLFTWHEVNESTTAFGLVGLQLETGNIYAKASPLLLVTCKKCSYVRMHRFGDISKWAADGKPEFVEEPPGDE